MERKKTSEKLQRIWITISIFFACFMGNGCYVYASNYGENVGTWFLDQLFWVALVIIAFVLVMCLLKKAWIGALITGICGGIILFLIRDPKKLTDIGETIWNIIIGG